MNLFVNTPRQDEPLPLAQEIIQVADDFTEFNSVNAFLCSAFAAVMSRHEPLSEEVIQGAKKCAESIQSRAQELKHSIGHVRERYLAEQSEIKSRK